jgi:thymidylate synthase ThyX
MSIEAKIIADSKSIRGERLTTFLLTFPRIILAEFNTHRMFSRNSASSRAIPFAKMVESVETNPFIPIAWQKDHKGMQGTEYITGEAEIKGIKDEWLKARDSAIFHAKNLCTPANTELNGVTKQLCNRILEPFMWHTVICTATEYSNFFKLRDHEAAEIHIQELARRMKEAMNNSTPKILKVGEWHIPFSDDINDNQFTKFKDTLWQNKQAPTNGHVDLLLKIAIARCARVSYTTVGSTSNNSHTADIELYNRLLESGHMSPFEHCGQVMEDTKYCWKPYSRNFKGFTQYREIVETNLH